MGIHYKLLDIKIPPLKEGFEFLNDRRPAWYHRFRVEDIINDELIEFLREFGLNPKVAVAFHNKSTLNSYLIHTDYSDGTFMCGINWVFCEKTLMGWYKPKDTGMNLRSRSMSYTRMDGDVIRSASSILSLKDEEADIIEETTDKGPMLVNIGSVFHKSMNLTSVDRKAISIRFSKESAPSWEEIIKKLQPLIIEQRT